MRTRASMSLFFQFIAAVFIWEAVGIAPAWAATVTIQPPQADASLDENSPNTNRGNEPVLNVRSWAAGDFRVLVRFDLSSIAPGTTITSADLELCLDRISGDQSTRTYGAHRLTKSWVEGEVTANQASNGVPWGTFFGDFAAATSTVNLSKVNLTDNPDRFISWNVTSDVQAFVNGALVNNGWLIKDGSENKSTLYRTDWLSKESASTACGPASSPRLRIVSSSGAVVRITSPSPGSVINRSTVLVLGDVNVPTGTEVGVPVNGIVGLVSNGIFSALVPVDPSVTNLMATATDANGTVLGSDTIPVTVQPPTVSLLFLTPSPGSGPAPLQVNLRASFLGPATNYQWDVDGNGTIDFTGSNLAELTQQYLTPGLYFPTVTVTDSQGTQFTETAPLLVFSQAEVVTLLQAKWQGFKDALRAGNVSGALQFIVQGNRNEYQQIFQNLTVPLSAIDQVLSNISFVQFRERTVEFEMLRTDERAELSYLVRFVIDQDGIWRIKDM